MTAPAALTWHQALAYAVTGRRYPELGRQPVPDLDLVAAFLRRQQDGADAPVLSAGPHRLPPDLTAGLGPAQLWAAVAELRRRLEGPARPPVVAAPVLPGPDDQRLLRDVPPHHGS
jgi:hypothetical protein